MTDIWTTTAAEDGDCAIIDSERQLVGVGATVVQTIEIVKKHHAALAAWSKEHHLAYLDWEKQLAAERNCSKRFEIQVDEAQKQLAAERERFTAVQKYGMELTERLEHHVKEADEFYKRAESAEQQLAAEREKVQTLVDALEKHDETTCDYKDWVELRKTALAKVKEKK